jgi:hypothetical protein
LKPKRILLLIATLFLFITIGCVAAEARLAPAGVQYDRQAVVNEAYYAIAGQPYFYPTANVGQWNYIASDMVAFQHVMDKWTTAYKPDGVMTHPLDSKMRTYFLNKDMKSYGFYGNKGRGAQCKFFANYLLYRAGVTTNVDPMTSYAGMAAQSVSTGFAKPGDVLFKKGFHTAIVGQVLSGDSSKGTVTRVEVIDSNWVGGEDNEIIGKHVYSGADLATYSIWTGTPYYSCSY